VIEIDRLALEVRAAAARERAEGLARRVREAALAGLERRRIALASVPDGAYVFIEHLHFACAVNSAWDDSAIGDALAAALAASLDKAPRRDGATVFRDRPEFLAAFLLAAADGTAWARWWFDEFEGLKPLGASAAIRTALVGAGEAGADALARLTESAASRVLRTLSTGDAARVLAWLGERPASAPRAPSGLWRRAASLCGGTKIVEWLEVLVACEREAPGSACAQTLETLRAMAALREAAGRGTIDAGALRGETPLAALQAFLLRRNLSTAWLGRVPQAELDAMVADMEALAGNEARSEKPTSGAPIERESTRHGGAFVLLGTLARSGRLERWQARLARRMSPREAQAHARALALRVIAAALAPHAPEKVEHDPALRLAMDVTGAGDAARPVRRAAAALLHATAQRILGLEGSSVAYLRENALSLSAAVERQGAQVTVRLGRAPLDVLLVLSGVKRGAIDLPGGVRVEMREDAAA
jgi:hypothetical protein